MEANLEESRRHLRSIRSIFGCVTNAFTSNKKAKYVNALRHSLHPLTIPFQRSMMKENDKRANAPIVPAR